MELLTDLPVSVLTKAAVSYRFLLKSRCVLNFQCSFYQKLLDAAWPTVTVFIHFLDSLVPKCLVFAAFFLYNNKISISERLATGTTKLPATKTSTTKRSTTRVTKSTPTFPTRMPGIPKSSPPGSDSPVPRSTGPEFPGLRPTGPTLSHPSPVVFRFHSVNLVVICSTLAVIGCAVLGFIYMYYFVCRRHVK